MKNEQQSILLTLRELMLNTTNPEIKILAGILIKLIKDK